MLEAIKSNWNRLFEQRLLLTPQLTTDKHKWCQLNDKQSDVFNFEHRLHLSDLNYTARSWIERSIFFQRFHYIVPRYNILTNWLNNWQNIEASLMFVIVTSHHLWMSAARRSWDVYLPIKKLGLLYCTLLYSLAKHFWVSLLLFWFIYRSMLSTNKLNWA